MRIAVVGGGPAGLFFARQLRRHDPSVQIDIFEQNPEHATYGFGVTLAGAARDRLHAADPELMERLSARMVFNNIQAISIDDERLLVRYAGSGGAIARLTLLEEMESLCRDVGLTVRHDRRITTAADLDGYDLIVGADGANSVVRSLWEADFAPVRRPLGNRFAWYGVNKALKPNALAFRRHEGGVYIGHYYAYTADRSTFVAECDAETWERGGLSALSDARRKALIEKIFEVELEGESLQENKSTWRGFDAVTASAWSAERAVLIGDALRVAHFSIGSGTRLAMDDALALFAACTAHGADVPALIAAYTRERRRTRDLFTEATVNSFEWYEEVRSHISQPLPDFVHAFLTRTGRVDDERLKSYAPQFYARYLSVSQ